MGRVLIVGAGGVAQVVAHKCAQVPEVFGEIMLASCILFMDTCMDTCPVADRSNRNDR